MYDFSTVYSRAGTGSEKWDRAAAEGCPEGVVPLTTADMEFKVAPEIQSALKQAVDFGLLGYAAPTEAYVESVCSWMQTRHGWHPKAEWMVHGMGIVPAIYTAVRAFTRPGDGVLVQPPVYLPFFSAAHKNGRKLVEAPLHTGADGRFEIDFDALRRHAKRARLMLLCSPHNPGGRVWAPDEIRTIAEICLENRVVLFADEIHCDVLMPGVRHTSAGGLPRALLNHCLVATSPAKSFNLAGLPCSAVFVPNQRLRRQFRAQAEVDGAGFNTALGVAAAEAAYTRGAPWLDALLPTLADNYTWLKAALAERVPALRVAPQDATYLAWIDCSALGMGRAELTAFLQQEAQLYAIPGEAFGTGGEGYIRLNFACPRRVLEDTVARLEAACGARGLI